MIIDINTYTNSVVVAFSVVALNNTYTNSIVVAFSVVALNNKVGRSRGVAERSWHAQTQFAIEFS